MQRHHVRCIDASYLSLPILRRPMSQNLIQSKYIYCLLLSVGLCIRNTMYRLVCRHKKRMHITQQLPFVCRCQRSLTLLLSYQFLRVPNFRCIVFILLCSTTQHDMVLHLTFYFYFGFSYALFMFAFLSSALLCFALLCACSLLLLDFIFCQQQDQTQYYYHYLLSQSQHQFIK